MLVMVSCSLCLTMSYNTVLDSRLMPPEHRTLKGAQAAQER